jgi:hypothetical protein
MVLGKGQLKLDKTGLKAERKRQRAGKKYTAYCTFGKHIKYLIFDPFEVPDLVLLFGT